VKEKQMHLLYIAVALLLGILLVNLIDHAIGMVYKSRFQLLAHTVAWMVWGGLWVVVLNRWLY
jgi:hypothetical protein